MSEPPGRNAHSVIRIESNSDAEGGSVHEGDDGNNSRPAPTSPTSSFLQEDQDAKKLSQRSNAGSSKDMRPSKLDARPGRHTVDTPDYKDQVRSRRINAIIELGNEEDGTPDYKDQVRSRALDGNVEQQYNGVPDFGNSNRSNNEEVGTPDYKRQQVRPTRHYRNRNNHHDSDDDDDSASSFASASALQAEVVDADLEAARLRQQILRELEDQTPVAAEVVASSTLLSRRRRDIRMRTVLLVFVVAAVVVGAVVATTMLVVNNNDGSELGAGVSRSDAPTTLSPSMQPSMSPTVSFWTDLGDVVRGSATGNRLGDSVALSANGRILATGGQGTAFQDGGDGIGRIRVFELTDDNGTWLQLGQDIEGSFGKNLGRAVSLSRDGQIVAGGEHFGGDQIQGRVLVHRFNASSQQWDLLGQELYGDGVDGNQPWFGFSVSLSDDGLTLAVGAPIHNGAGFNAGRLRVFRYSVDSQAWLQLGLDIEPTQEIGQLGISVSLSGDGLRLAAGAYFTQPKLTYEAGRVTVYQFANGDWEQIGQQIDGEFKDDFLGWSVALTTDGTRLACSDILFDSVFGESVGRVRVFEVIDSVWKQVGQPLIGNAAGNELGSSIALSNDGTTLVVGAIDLGGGTRPGYMRVFNFDGRDWNQLGTDLKGDNPGDRFGTWVAASADGTIIAGGSPFNDANGMDSGLVRVYKTELL